MEDKNTATQAKTGKMRMECTEIRQERWMKDEGKILLKGKPENESEEK